MKTVKFTTELTKEEKETVINITDNELIIETTDLPMYRKCQRKGYKQDEVFMYKDKEIGGVFRTVPEALHLDIVYM